MLAGVVPSVLARQNNLNCRLWRRVQAEVDEVQGPGGEFQSPLRIEVLAEPLLVDCLELLNSFRRRLREEDVAGRIGWRHGGGLRAKAAGYRVHGHGYSRGRCAGSMARAPCRSLCHAYVLIPNPIL